MEMEKIINYILSPRIINFTINLQMDYRKLMNNKTIIILILYNKMRQMLLVKIFLIFLNYQSQLKKKMLIQILCQIFKISINKTKYQDNLQAKELSIKV